MAFFKRGSGVQGSEGISPSLAVEALVQYKKIYAEQAMHDERVTALELVANAGVEVRQNPNCCSQARLEDHSDSNLFPSQLIPQMKTLCTFSRSTTSRIY